MSFFKKMFRGKEKGDEEDEGASGHTEAPRTPPMDEKRRLRNNLSVSRSGRYKQKKRERSALLNQPELFDSPNDSQEAQKTQERSAEQQKASPKSYNRTPNGSYSKCRGLEPTNHRLASNSSLSRQSAKV